MNWFYGLGVVAQALIAGLFTWFITLLGAGSVFIFKNPSRKVLDMMLGFAAGVMIAASFWSLLSPAIDMAESMGMIPWVPAVVGFLLGAGILRLLDLVLPHLHPGEPVEHAEGIHTTWKKTVLLVVAITLHNIPEGLAVGVAFGAIGAGIPSAGIAGAIALAIGIGIQNFPEGLAVSAPLRREGMSVGASFFWGQMSAMVEPLFAVIGAALVMVMQPILPYALAFAAGAMIFVVVEDVIPESQLSGNSDISTHGAILGFSVMMLLDVALG